MFESLSKVCLCKFFQMFSERTLVIVPILYYCEQILITHITLKTGSLELWFKTETYIGVRA